MDSSTVLLATRLIIVGFALVELWWALQLFRGAVDGNAILGRWPLTTLLGGVTMLIVTAMFASEGALQLVLVGVLLVTAIATPFVRAWEKSAPDENGA